MPLMPYGLSEDKILELPSQPFDTVVEQCDVFIAGSGIVA
jgi:hypothetical protein